MYGDEQIRAPDHSEETRDVKQKKAQIILTTSTKNSFRKQRARKIRHRSQVNCRHNDSVLGWTRIELRALSCPSVTVAGFVLCLAGEDLVPEQTREGAQAGEETGGDDAEGEGGCCVRGPPSAPADGSSGRGRHMTRRSLGAMVRISAPVRWGSTSVKSRAETLLGQ